MIDMLILTILYKIKGDPAEELHVFSDHTYSTYIQNTLHGGHLYPSMDNIGT
jgi:hypothetical protein